MTRLPRDPERRALVLTARAILRRGRALADRARRLVAAAEVARPGVRS